MTNDNKVRLRNKDELKAQNRNFNVLGSKKNKEKISG